MPHIPEYLALAGSPSTLRAAGADAVYLGGKTFGARRYAANFSREELTTAVEYAPKNGVKVYVTVNTLADDEELSGIVEYLTFLSEISTDAIRHTGTGSGNPCHRLRGRAGSPAARIHPDDHSQRVRTSGPPQNTASPASCSPAELSLEDVEERSASSPRSTAGSWKFSATEQSAMPTQASASSPP